MVEPEDKATVHLDAVVVQDADPPGIVGRPRTLLSALHDVLGVQRLEADEDAGAAGQGHFAHEGRVIGHVDRDRGAPDFFQGPQGSAQPPQVFGPGAEVVVHEHAVRLAVGGELGHDLLRVANQIGHVQSVGG